MKLRLAAGLVVTSLLLTVGIGPITPARAAGGGSCSPASISGEFAFNYSGNAVTSTGLVPVAAVGSYHSDAAGNFVGTEVNSLGGTAGFQTIQGTITLSGDCSGLLVANVYQAGQLVRTSYIHLQYSSDGNQVYGIFQKLVLPDHSTLPVVVTITGNRLTPH